MTNIEELKNNPAKFVKEFLGKEITPIQKQILDTLDAANFIPVTSRIMGSKTEYTAHVYAFDIINNPKPKRVIFLNTDIEKRTLEIANKMLNPIGYRVTHNNKTGEWSLCKEACYE